MRLLILTAARTKEIIEAQFAEFDKQKRWWTIPAQKMKVRKEHIVPLSNEALAIIGLMRRKHNHGFVFANLLTGNPISNGAMLVFLKKRFSKYKTTVHGFRSTFRTWAEETGKYPHHAIEFCLAHQLKDSVEAAYLRSTLIEKRKILMQDWADYCYGACS